MSQPWPSSQKRLGKRGKFWGTQPPSKRARTTAPSSSVKASRDNKIFKYKRSSGALGVSSFNNISDTLVGLEFSLATVPNYTEFTDLYDFYRITGIVIHYLPDQTQLISTGNVNSTDNIPLITVVDTSDVNPPISVDELREYDNHKVRSIITPFREYFVPKWLDAERSQRTSWVACANPNTRYYGYKYAAPPTNNSGVGFSAWIEVTFYLEFKKAK